MSQQWRPFKIPVNVKEKLRGLLDQQPEIFRYSDQPELAALLACLGIQSELGNKELDRLAPILATTPDHWSSWKNEIVQFDGQIGIRIWNPLVKELRVPDSFHEVVHGLSFAPGNQDGAISELFIFPNLIATILAARGIDLVIVKTWVLSTFLAEKDPVNYVRANVWEIENNATRLQVEFMSQSQLPFSGLHDLVDHMIGADPQGICDSAYLPQLKEFFLKKTSSSSSDSWTPEELTFSYVIGALLDDLAQPPLYRARRHHYLLGLAMKSLERAKEGTSTKKSVKYPPSLNQLMALLRNQKVDFFDQIDSIYLNFEREVFSLY